MNNLSLILLVLTISFMTIILIDPIERDNAAEKMVAECGVIGGIPVLGVHKRVECIVNEN